MSCVKTSRFDPEPLTSATTTERFKPKTPWTLVADSDPLVGAIRTYNLGGNFQVYLGVQYAAVHPSSPDTPSTVGSAISSSTTTGVSGTLSASDKMWVRLGYIYNLSTGSTPAGALVGMDLATCRCSKVIGRRLVSVPPSLTASGSDDDALVVPVTEFVPAIDSPKLKATLIGRDLLNYGDMRTKLVYRTALDKENPNSWQFGLEASWDTPAGSTDVRNTTELSPTIGSNYLVQAGIAVRRHTGGSQVRGDFEVSVALIR